MEYGSPALMEFLEVLESLLLHYCPWPTF